VFRVRGVLFELIMELLLRIYFYNRDASARGEEVEKLVRVVISNNDELRARTSGLRQFVRYFIDSYSSPS
jgi:hypothetical protein